MSTSMTALVVVFLVLAVLVLAVLAVVGVRGWRSRRLRDTFGPEYDRTIDEAGSREEAERVLEERVERRRELEIRDLDETTRQRYADEWRAVQSRFVDDPRGAVQQADELVTRAISDRGYPTNDFDQQMAVVSVVSSYRHAHEVMLLRARDGVATDDLRQAMVHYRELFELLIGQPVTVETEPAPETRSRPAEEAN
jgi:hypothetical protein